MGLTVIIPTLNEAAIIGQTVSHVVRSNPTEVIVVDGGSTDDTRALAKVAGATVLSAPCGRGTQQRYGAEHAQTEQLLFLHADTRLPKNFPELVGATLSSPGVVAGAFRFKLDAEGWRLRLIEHMVDVRCRLLQVPYGDQALFLRTETLAQVGGFPDLPLMEDYELVRRLKRLGKIRIADGDAVTSARRWNKLGVTRATWTNLTSLFAYHWGATPKSIASRRRT